MNVVSIRMNSKATGLEFVCPCIELHSLANKNAERLVAASKLHKHIEGQVALLSGPSVHSLYGDLA